MTGPGGLRPPVRGAAELQRWWGDLMGTRGFETRGLWLAFLDHHDRPGELVVPIADLPDEPEQDLLRSLGSIVDVLVDDDTVSAVPLLLTRPGGAAFTAADRRWARALHAHLGLAQGGWPLHLGTHDAVRPFGVDDLLAAG